MGLQHCASGDLTRPLWFWKGAGQFGSWCECVCVCVGECVCVCVCVCVWLGGSVALCIIDCIFWDSLLCCCLFPSVLLCYLWISPERDRWRNISSYLKCSVTLKLQDFYLCKNITVVFSCEGAVCDLWGSSVQSWPQKELIISTEGAAPLPQSECCTDMFLQ